MRRLAVSGLVLAGLLAAWAWAGPAIGPVRTDKGAASPAAAPAGKALASLELVEGYDYGQVLYSVIISPAVPVPAKNDPITAMLHANAYAVNDAGAYAHFRFLKFTRAAAATSLGKIPGYIAPYMYGDDRGYVPVKPSGPSLEKQAEEKKIGLIVQAVVVDTKFWGSRCVYRVAQQAQVMGRKGWQSLTPKPVEFQGSVDSNKTEAMEKEFNESEFNPGEALVFIGMLPMKVIGKKSGETGLRLTLTVQNRFAEPVKNLTLVASPAKGAKLAAKADIDVEIQPGETQTVNVSINIDNPQNYSLWVQPREKPKVAAGGGAAKGKKE